MVAVIIDALFGRSYTIWKGLQTTTYAQWIEKPLTFLCSQLQACHSISYNNKTYTPVVTIILEPLKKHKLNNKTALPTLHYAMLHALFGRSYIIWKELPKYIYILLYYICAVSWEATYLFLLTTLSMSHLILCVAGHTITLLPAYSITPMLITRKVLTFLDATSSTLRT